MRVLSTAEKEQPCFGVELIWDWRFGVSFLGNSIPFGEF